MAHSTASRRYRQIYAHLPPWDTHTPMAPSSHSPITSLSAGLPSGMHQARVTDMARFMIAHLEHGRYGDENIRGALLKEITMQQMQSTLYTPDPRLLGYRLRLFDMSDNGQRNAWASRYSPPMSTQLLLFARPTPGYLCGLQQPRRQGRKTDHTALWVPESIFRPLYPALQPLHPGSGRLRAAGRSVRRSLSIGQ